MWISFFYVKFLYFDKKIKNYLLFLKIKTFQNIDKLPHTKMNNDNNKINQQELEALIALTSLDNIGAVTAKQLISYVGNVQEIFTLSESKLLRIPQIGQATAQIILTKGKQAIENAKKIAENTEKLGGKIITYLDDTYPQRLHHIYDAPPILYFKGHCDFNVPRTLAVIGTREATEYGKKIVWEFLKELQPYNPLIVSGLAYGIDIASHRQSLTLGLQTIGVMASGLDIIYPHTHTRTAEDMQSLGGILTENPIGTKPDAMRFPARNRIIAGMVDAILVVEAKKKGGALITAELGNEYNKEVFAVPNNVFSVTSEGCNNLIRQNKAFICTSAQEIAEMMHWNTAIAFENKKNAQQQSLFNTPENGLSIEDEKIWKILQKAPEQTLQLDELAWQAQMPVSQTNAILLNLELAGLVKAIAGKKFVLC